MNGVEVPTATDLSVGWLVKVGTVSLTRSEAAELVAVPRGFVTTQRNWSWSIAGVTAAVSVVVVTPL